MKATLASTARSCAVPKTTDNRSIAPTSTFTPSSRLQAPTVASKARDGKIPLSAHLQAMAQEFASNSARNLTPPAATPVPMTQASRSPTASEPATHRCPRLDNALPATRSVRTRPPAEFIPPGKSAKASVRARARADRIHSLVLDFPPLPPKKPSIWAKTKAHVSAGFRRLAKGNGKNPLPGTVQAQSGPTAKKAGQDKKTRGLVKALAVCGIGKKREGARSSPIPVSAPLRCALKKPGSAPKPRKTVGFGNFEVNPVKRIAKKKSFWQKHEKTPKGEAYDEDEKKWF